MINYQNENISPTIRGAKDVLVILRISTTALQMNSVIEEFGTLGTNVE
jgi:hypothetical protein